MSTCTKDEAAKKRDFRLCLNYNEYKNSRQTLKEYLKNRDRIFMGCARERFFHYKN